MKRRQAASAILSVLTLTACVPQDLAFRQDTRLEFTEPSDGATVVLPTTISWTMRDFAVRSKESAGGSFAVFIDARPMPPGETLAWLARKDTECAERPGCPGPKYLARQGVYETTLTSLRLKELPIASDTKEHHDVTVVLLDEDGRRIGEISYYTAFETDQEDPS